MTHPEQNKNRVALDIRREPSSVSKVKSNQTDRAVNSKKMYSIGCQLAYNSRWVIFHARSSNTEKEIIQLLKVRSQLQLIRQAIIYQSLKTLSRVRQNLLVI